jgi:hypothetical protein
MQKHLKTYKKIMHTDVCSTFLVKSNTCSDWHNGEQEVRFYPLLTLRSAPFIWFHVIRVILLMLSVGSSHPNCLWVCKSLETKDPSMFNPNNCMIGSEDPYHFLNGSKSSLQSDKITEWKRMERSFTADTLSNKNVSFFFLSEWTLLIS